MYFKKSLFIFCFGPRAPNDYLLYKTNEYYLAGVIEIKFDKIISILSNLIFETFIG